MLIFDTMMGTESNPNLASFILMLSNVLHNSFKHYIPFSFPLSWYNSSNIGHVHLYSYMKFRFEFLICWLVMNGGGWLIILFILILFYSTRFTLIQHLEHFTFCSSANGVWSLCQVALRSCYFQFSGCLVDGLFCLSLCLVAFSIVDSASFLMIFGSCVSGIFS